MKEGGWVWVGSPDDLTGQQQTFNGSQWVALSAPF